MPSPALSRFLALAPEERSIVALLVVVHAPLNRSAMVEWLRLIGVRSSRAHTYNSTELLPLIESWVRAGILVSVEERRAGSHGYRPEGALSHAVLGYLLARKELTGLARHVRGHAPLFERYSYGIDARRLTREILLSMYLGTNEELERALTLWRPPYGQHAGDLFVEALGLDVPLAGLSGLPQVHVQTYLERALGGAARALQPVGEGLLSYLHANRAALSAGVLAMAAEYLTLRAEPAQAAALLGAESDAELLAARCLVALSAEQFPEARAYAKRALVQTRAKKSRKLKGLGSPLWPWVVLALLTDTEDPEALGLAREQLAISAHKDAERYALISALSSLDRFFAPPEAGQAAPELGVVVHAQEGTELLVCALVARFTGAKLSIAVRERLARMRERADEQGFAWLAAELARLEKAGPATGLACMYAPEEPWQRAVRALDGAIELAGRAELLDDAAPMQERLVWSLVVEGDGQHQLGARVQVRTAGGFSSGRQISLKKLQEAPSDASWMSDEDRRVIRHVRSVRDNFQPVSHVFDSDAPLSLVGHPRVFGDHECREPVEVVRGMVRVEVHEEGGEIVLGLTPRACLERELVCERESHTRVIVYALTPGQQLIAKQLSSKGLRLPVQARGGLQRALGKLVTHFPVASELDIEAAHIEEVAADPRIHLQLRRAAQGLIIRPRVAPLGEGPTFAPGAGRVSVLGTRKDTEGMRTLRSVRDLDDERARLSHILEVCPTLRDSELTGTEHRVADLTSCLELICELRGLGDEVVIEWPEGKPLSIAAERELREVHLRLSSEGAWLSAQGELEVDAGLKLSLRELLERTSKQRGRFIALDDGRFLALSEDLKRTLDGVAALSHVRAGKVELHPLALFGVASLADTQLEHDTLVAERLARAREAAALEPEIPSAFEATLRPYQREGFAWLSRLAHWGAGACLADDMGLGKTLQALALLVERAARGPSLVVAPTSVCANWQDESRRYAPSLRVVSLGAGDREQVLSELGPFDLLVCSYGILQQERERLQQKHFQVVVLDEAQAIKNASTLRAKAALGLVSDVRVALTGTPVENHVGELWSIMNFLNPGLLGSSKSFEERFGRPIQRDGDRQAAQLLRRLVRPFVLRRKKSEVLDDLPEKTVITLRVEPSEAERALFAALREQALARLTDRDKPAESRVRLLAELMRMRRAACHPALVAPQAGIESSKLATLEALLEELRHGGHRALVFSQFVDYLGIVRARLSALGISYQYLDGSSSPQARANAVQAFQAGRGEVFLISLKAGGFGLNLTAADYVVHLDPWWNPAVEDQASDRAHRIGQTRPVTIYRLVMEGSIEEKILLLHAEKRDLADQLLEGTGSSGALGLDELMGLLREANDDTGQAPARASVLG
jgi:superfamily II DNA or RNA helicase